MARDALVIESYRVGDPVGAAKLSQKAQAHFLFKVCLFVNNVLLANFRLLQEQYLQTAVQIVKQANILLKDSLYV